MWLLILALAYGATHAPSYAQTRPTQTATPASSAVSISYEVGMSRPTTHLYEVAIGIENVSQPYLDLQFPMWLPGHYLLANPARNVQEFGAATSGGRKLPSAKIDVNTWRVETGGNKSVRVSYKVYADDPTVDGAHLDDTHAFFNGANLFAYVVGAKERPVTLVVNQPPRWTNISTGLDPLAGRPDTFAAPDYDTFIDAPFEIGTHDIRRFDYKGARYEIAIYGNHNYDISRFQSEIERIVRSQVDMMCVAPFKRYVFIYHMLPEGRAGLEHLNSTVINRRKYAGDTEAGWDSVRGVTSHEFFHLWNVKRLRPVALGPFDYTRQVTTRDLYVSEGMTSYYGDLHLQRSRLWTPERYFKELSREIQTLQDLPARRILTVEESSINTWFKSDNDANSNFSYYNKGELLALLLDLEIRQRTKNSRSLDDVFLYLYRNYALPKPGWTEGGFERAVEAVAGQDFGEFFRRYVSGTDELPYERVLAYAGLRLERRESGAPDFGFKVSTEPTAAGAVGVTVETVSSEGAAFNVLAPKDVLLAVDGERATQAALPAQLSRFREGQRVPLTIFRGDRLLDVSMTLTARRLVTYTVTEDPAATPQQKALREAWLKGRDLCAENAGSHLPAGLDFVVEKSYASVEANAARLSKEPPQCPPYAEGSTVSEIRMLKDAVFARVYAEEKDAIGSWVLLAEDIEGLSPEQIRDKFALRVAPKNRLKVDVPAGTRLRVGRVGELEGWGKGGGLQFELIGEHLPVGAFREREPLASK